MYNGVLRITDLTTGQADVMRFAIGNEAAKDALRAQFLHTATASEKLALVRPLATATTATAATAANTASTMPAPAPMALALAM